MYSAYIRVRRICIRICTHIYVMYMYAYVRYLFNVFMYTYIYENIVCLYTICVKRWATLIFLIFTLSMSHIGVLAILLRLSQSRDRRVPPPPPPLLQQKPASNLECTLVGRFKSLLTYIHRNLSKHSRSVLKDSCECYRDIPIGWTLGQESM